jgi:hypothetical protein
MPRNRPSFVITGLVPVIPLKWATPAFLSEMAGTSPAMTAKNVLD